MPPGEGRRDDQHRRESDRDGPSAPERPRCGLAVVLRERSENRNVAAPWQLDSQWTGLALSEVVLAQPGPQPACFRPYDRIFLRVITGSAAKDLDPDQGFFEFLVVTGQMPLDHKPEKSR